MKRLLPLLLAVLLSIAALAGMSIRAYVGDADTIVSPDASVRFVEALAAQGGDASVTVFAGVDHFGVPRAAYLSGDRALLSFLSFAD